jgi:transposase
MPKLYAGLDVSNATTSICIVDFDGVVRFECSTQTDPTSIAAALRPYRRSLQYVGQESGSRAAYLHKALLDAKYPMECVDARHAHAYLTQQLNKTDANDAKGIALLLARGLFSRAYIKSDEAIRIRAVLGLRETLLFQAITIRNALAGTRRALGYELAESRKKRSGDEGSRPAMLTALASAASGIEALQIESRRLDACVREIARDHPVCQRLMAVPGVGPITALTFVAAIDDPSRFRSSRTVAAYLGLTPRVFQSGVSTRSGSISHRGDKSARTALYNAARALVSTSKTTWYAREWGRRIAREKGYKVAYVACARKLAVIMHRLWVTGENFDPSRR